MKSIHFLLPLAFLLAISCGQGDNTAESDAEQDNTSTDSTSIKVIQPRVVTQAVEHDTDDPAIWINPKDLNQSLIIGTDKDSLGALYAFDLDGRIVKRSVTLNRPNNVDVAYGLMVNGVATDYAITGERHSHMMRIFSLPDMQPIDGGGIPVYVGEVGPEYRDLMGMVVYVAPDGEHYAIAGRKNGPTDGTYLWQYRLYGKNDGTVGAELVRKFGNFSGRKEIEAIAVDHNLGYIYYSDEQAGVRKYHAHPYKGNEELAFFATEGFLDDHEGVSIYNLTDSTGYIIVSDQRRNAFRMFPREGSNGNPHAHPEVGVVFTATNNSDGNEITTESFNGRFPGGLFVAMSDDRTFQYYSWKDMAEGQFEVRMDQ